MTKTVRYTKSAARVAGKTYQTACTALVTAVILSAIVHNKK